MNLLDQDHMEQEGDFQILRPTPSDRDEMSDDRLTRVLVDGKTIFISPDSPSLIPRLKQRSLRGDDCLVELMNSRLNACEELIKELVSVNVIRGLEVHESLECLKDIADCIDGVIPSLVEIENEIDQKRSSIPGYSDLLDYHYQIEESRSEGDQERVNELQHKRPEHYQSFCLAFDDILDFVQQGRKLRFSLLLDKYQLCSYHYTLLRQFVNWNVSRTVEALRALSGDDLDYREYIPVIESLAGIPELFPFKTDPSQPLKKQIECIEIEIEKITDAIENRLIKAKSYLTKVDALLDIKRSWKDL